VRVLDLGCGSGSDLASWGVTASDEVTGLDIDNTCLSIAKTRFCNRSYVQGAGECLPFRNKSFDRVISTVALPYMDIQKTLGEVHRILVPGGRLSLTLHRLSFTITELLHNAIPKPIPTLFRLYVMANGSFFHLTGRTVGFLPRRTESFQTERGIRIALSHAGFVNFSFRRGTGPVGETFIVEARNATFKKTFTAAA
jgi:ubiquinone/menaquinone biosynthesis C-methylase UbiE